MYPRLVAHSLWWPYPQKRSIEDDPYDIGYELQSSLLVNAQNGNPLSGVAQNWVSAEGLWQSRQAKIQDDEQTHLDALSDRIDWIEQQQFAKRLVHIVDREADSVAAAMEWTGQ